MAPTPLDGRVFFTDTTATLKYVQPSGGSSTTQFSGLAAAPTEVAFDEVNGKVYLGYASTGLIERRNLDGTGATPIATGQTSVSGLAVDSVHGFVYWTRLDNDTINRRNSDGSGTITTLTGLNNPEGIAVDPLNATVYWLETQGNLLRIRKGGLDFSNPTDLFAPTTIGSGNHNPRDLEIDALRGKLYWADDKAGTNGDFIGVVNLDGTGLQQYITNAATSLVDTPQGLGIDAANGFIYWSDSTGLRKASVLGGSFAATGIAPIPNLGDVEVPSQFSYVGSFDVDKTFATVPLTDDYDPTELRFVSATVAPSSVDPTNGIIAWSNVGPIDANETRTIYVTFEVLQPPGNATNANVDNTATVTGALVANGLPTNDDTATVVVTANPAAVIGDRIWSDKNGDGTDAGQATEPGIAGVLVRLFDSADAIELQRTLTDATGAYRFTGVVAGTYIVRVDTTTLPSGFTPRFDADGTGSANQSTVTITTAANPADNLGQDFGYTITNIFFGSVWQDFDGNGSRDTTDVGIGGATVRLRNSTDTADVSTTTTAPDGTYRFVGIANGSYRVRVDATTLPTGVSWTQTAEVFPTGTPADGSLDNFISTGGAITASGGDVRGSYEFGYRRFGNSSIGDEVFYDLDGDGTRDLTESGIANVTVYLYEDLNATGVLEAGFDAIVAATETNANGVYTFGNLAAGRYIVVVDGADAQFPSNVIATTANPSAVNLASATAVTTADFGYQPGPNFVQPATIGDFVYYDANANGEQDFNELGIGGVVLRLYSDVNNNQLFDAGSDLVYGTVTTSFGGAGNPPVGYYQFTNLPPDSNPNLSGNNPYVVQVVEIPATAITTLADQTADPNRDGVPAGDNTFPGLPPADNQDTGKFIDLNLNAIADPGETGIFVSVGTNYAGADFGYRPTGVVGDYIWLDLNNNGRQDSTELGLSNVTVAITNVPFSGATTLTTATDFNGMYFFQGLTAGMWRITVTPPASVTPSTRVDANLLAGTGSVGANTADLTIDADGNVTAITFSGSPLNFAAPNEDDGTKIDFGYRLTGSNTLAGRVVLEQNGTTDGNAGEVTDTPVAGASVFLYDGSGNLLGSTVTDASGNYNFLGLPSGTYSVSMVANLPILANTMLTTDNFSPGSLPPNTAVTDNGTAAVAEIILTGSVSNLDFAWVSTVDYDFGDLPDSYATSLAVDGARHIISGTPALYLGAVPPDTEGNATPGASAMSDDTTGTDDEDGITALNPTTWTEGANSGTTNTLRVSVTGNGWLVGWIDFDADGSFLASNELVVNQAVTTGSYDFAITVPSGTFVSGGAVLNTRFRLFTEAPLVPQIAFIGIATGGEVEDTSLVVGVPTFADLSLTKTASTTTPNVGGNVTFTITVHNDGPATATGVTIQDVLPSGLQYVSDTSGGAFSGGVWTVGTISSGANAVLTVTATVLATGSYTNAAQVATSNELDPDSTPGDNSTTQDDDDSVTLTPVLPATASIAGSVFVDLDNDGVRDPNEIGISGVTVILSGTDAALNPVSSTTTTDANGDYIFALLASGTYAITETQPAVYGDGQDRAGTANGTLTNDQVSGIPLTAGQAATGYTFGERVPNSIAGFVYRDSNLDGVRTITGADPDTGIAGITITLTGTDVLNNVVSRTTQTNTSGAYLFDNLLSGTYTIVETQPPLPAPLTNGFYDGADNVGTPTGTSPAKNQLRVALTGNAAQPATAATGYNFGELPPAAATGFNFGELPLADPLGFVYVDQNQNGLRDPGEPGIPNVSISISGTAFAGTIFSRPLLPSDIPGGSLTILTDANGLYQYNPIPPGLYTIRETQPVGYVDGAEENADPTDPPPSIGNDVFANIVLNPFPVRGPFNFGEIVPSVPLPPPPPVPLGDINKTLYLSSTVVGVNTSTTPLYVNSVERLGIQSPLASIGVAVGTDAGRPTQVRLLDYRTASERLSFSPYPGFMGGVRVATGDINGDGIDDVVTATGPGASPHVKAFDGATGQLLLSFYAYAPGYLGGVNVAVGDINNDGFADVVTSPGPMVGPHVKAFDGRNGSEVFSFYAYAPQYLGGVSVAVGDVNNDGFADIVTGTGIGGPPHVKAFDGRNLTELLSFYAFAPGYIGGINVAVGDTDGDRIGELIAVAASGPSSHVVVREIGGAQELLASFYAWQGYTGNGIRVATADINGDGASDLILGAGPSGGTRVSIFRGRSFVMLEDFIGFDDPQGLGGVFVG